MPSIDQANLNLEKVFWNQAAVTANHVDGLRLLAEMIERTADEEHDNTLGQIRDLLRRLRQETADLNTLAFRLEQRGGWIWRHS